MIEVILVIVGIVIFIVWLIKRKPKVESDSQLELRLKEEFFEREKEYRDMIARIRLKHQEEISELKREFSRQEKSHRQDAVNRSRNTIMGKLWETVAPYLPKFRYHAADMRFLGSPVDYVIFKGMNKKDITEIVFLEVKSGESKLNEQEEKVKKAIKQGRVRWDEFRIK